MLSSQPIDVRDVAIVHRIQRKMLVEAAHLVRAASAPLRVSFLAGHIDLGVAALPIHHEGEDELLYPKLIERPWKKYASTLHAAA
jgi:hypothetical protein